MGDSGNESPPAVVVRIRKRLAFQHARWSLSQPTRPRCFFDQRRRVCRQWRRLRIWINRELQPVHPLFALVGIAIAVLAATMLLAAIVCVVVLPSAMLLLPLENHEFNNSSEQVAVALLRLTMLMSITIVFYWLRCPGGSRATVAATQRTRQRQRKYESFIRKVRPRRPCLFERKITIAVLTVVAALAIAGSVIRLPHGLLAALHAVAAMMAIGWLVWRIGLRLMRIRSPLVGPLTIWDYLTMPTAVLGIFTLFAFSAPVTIRWSTYLSKLGPIGWLCGEIQSLGAGDFARVPLLILFITAAGMIGWIVAKDAGTWRQRRKLIESQRHLQIRPATIEATGECLSPQELRRRVGRGLDQTIIDRRCRSWRFWLTPIWLRRRWSWYVVTGVAILIFQVALIPIRLLIADIEPTTVIGGSARSPQEILTALAVVSLVLMFFAIECTALLDLWTARHYMFQQRPQSPITCWLETHREGLLRLPMQLILLLPFVPIAILVGTRLAIGGQLLFITIALLFLMRTVVATITVFAATLSTIRHWLSLTMHAVLGIAVYAACFAPLVIPVMMVRSPLPVANVPLGLSLANLAALLLFAFVCQLRDPPRVFQSSRTG